MKVLQDLKWLFSCKIYGLLITILIFINFIINDIMIKRQNYYKWLSSHALMIHIHHRFNKKKNPRSKKKRKEKEKNLINTNWENYFQSRDKDTAVTCFISSEVTTRKKPAMFTYSVLMSFMLPICKHWSRSFEHAYWLRNRVPNQQLQNVAINRCT